MFFLDTNICIYFLNGSMPSVRDHLLNTPPNEIKIPVIVHSELIFGAQKSKRKQENLQKANRFLKPFEIVNYMQEISETYAELRLKVESKGTTVGPNDLLIAAIAVSDNGTLVTRNTKEFSVIPQLKVEKW